MKKIIKRYENSQEKHFNSIADTYCKHYGDKWSGAYRDRFINKKMLQGINLYNKKVIDAMCGNGETVPFLLARGAQVTAIDISQQELKNLQDKWPQCSIHRSSILDTGLENNSYDCVVVVGGLHHVHPYCIDAIKEIHRILKKGGYLCFMEPHQGSIFDMIRKLWYKHDKYFEENEEAIDVHELKLRFDREFSFITEYYKGSIAYLFVLNSMIWRMPKFIKKMYAPFFFWLESWVERFQTKYTACFVVCQWKKK